MWYYKMCGKHKGLKEGSAADRIQGKVVCELSREMQRVAGKKAKKCREKRNRSIKSLGSATNTLTGRVMN